LPTFQFVTKEVIAEGSKRVRQDKQKTAANWQSETSWMARIGHGWTLSAAEPPSAVLKDDKLNANSTAKGVTLV